MGKYINFILFHNLQTCDIGLSSDLGLSKISYSQGNGSLYTCK
jgi:hypothetical protein